MGPSSVHETNFRSDAILILSATLLYKLLHFALSSYGPVSSHVASTGKHLYWFNIMTSWVNSIVIGIGAVYCFSLFPDMSEFTFSKHHAASHFMICVCLGYFIYDTMDCLREPKVDKVILFHHFLGFLTCGTIIFSHRYATVLIVGMLGEVNSFFLHARQLMNLSRVSRDSLIYKLNCLINILTFIVFRIGTSGWIFVWFIGQRKEAAIIYTTVAVFSSVTWLCGNLLLFFQLLSADFSRSKQKIEYSNLLNNSLAD
uniref:TLC domain-containing protein n=1 Tax=Ciona savignyi TaxID=51511 RepID=H2ZDH5_CIOSA